MCRGYVSIVVGLIVLGVIGAEGSTAYYGFLEEPINSRSIALGSAGTAVGAGGFSFYNPAALDLMQKSYVSVEFGKLADDLRRGTVEFGLVFPSWFLGGAFQSQSISFQYADERGVIPHAYGSEQGTMASLVAGLSKNRFGIGLAAHGIQNRIAENVSWGVSVSGGAVFIVIPGKLFTGIAYMHGYGRNTHYLDSSGSMYRDPLPATGRAGISWSDSIKGKLPYTVSGDIAYSFNYERVMVPLGAEVWVLPHLALRIGKRINHPTDLFSMGMGIKVENLRFDASFAPTRFVTDIDMKWSMGLTYEISGPKKKSESASSAVTSAQAQSEKSEADDHGDISADSATTPVESEKDTLSIDDVPQSVVPSSATEAEAESLQDHLEVQPQGTADGVEESHDSNQSESVFPETGLQSAVPEREEEGQIMTTPAAAGNGEVEP